MADYKLKGLRGEQRRRFLKMMGVAAAAVGLERSRFLNYLADEGGHGLAEAATNSGQRALGVTCGNGVFAWFQQLWPCPDVAATALAQSGFGSQSAYLYTTGHGYAGPAGFMKTTAEGKPFTKSQLDRMLELCRRGVQELTAMQRAVLKEQGVALGRA